MKIVKYIIGFVLFISITSHAALISIVTDGFDDNDSSGTMSTGDVVHIKVTSTVYLSSISVGIAVTGSGTLTEASGAMQHNSGFSPWGQSDPLIVANAIAQLSGISFGNVAPGDLLWNLDILCAAVGSIDIDLQLKSSSQYKVDPGDPNYLDLIETDLADLNIVVEATGPTVDLTATVSKGNGSVVPSAGSYPEDTVVTLTAQPDAGYRVKSWKGTNNNKSRLNTNTVTMDKCRTVSVEFEQIPDDQIDRALFKAGKTRASVTDILTLSGTLSTSQQELLAATSVTVQIDGPLVTGVFSDTVYFTDETFSMANDQLGFQIAGSLGGIGRMKFDTKTGKFSVMAAGLDLTGLSCPITVTITIGSYQQQFQLDEDVVNGSNSFIPIQYLFGQSDTLRVEKYNLRQNSKTATTTVTVQGSIAALNSSMDPSAAGSKITVKWGSFQEDIPAAGGTITKSKSGDKFSYKRPKSASATNFINDAQLDLGKGTFKVTIKDAVLQSQGDVAFTVQFIAAGNVTLYDQTDTISLPTP